MHFQSKLHNNSILTGSVDSYCLVCDNYLRSEDEAFTHTEKPIHKKNMGAATRVEKFLNDRIIKVKKGYYCPFCNILVSTITKVSIHISDTNHQEKKGAQMLSRVGDNVIIAFDEVAITLESWHGLTDDTCVICSTEFDENDVHTTDHMHILRLVQSKCEFGDKYVYRKVDEDSFFCLICGSVFSINEKLSHHESITHKNLYNSGNELRKTIPLQTNKKEVKKEVKETDKIDTKTATPEEKSTQSPDKTPIVLGDGKIKEILSKNEEIVTRNSAIASNISENYQKKPENTDVAVHNEKPEKEVHAKTTSDKAKSDILNRVDEFQKKGINIDFTWEKARCMRCVVYLPFDISAIEAHIEKQHNIEKKKDNIELKTDSKMQPKLKDNEVKLNTKKTDNGIVLLKYNKNVDFDIKPKTNIKRVENSVELKTNIKIVENGVEPKTNIKKVENGVEPIPNIKKVENVVEPITNIKKGENVVDPKANIKKVENVGDPKTNIKRVENVIEPKTNIKKVEKGVEPKRATKKQKNKPESSVLKTGTNKTNNGINPEEVLRKNDNAKEPKTDKKKQKKSDNDLKPDTKKEWETYAKENKMVIMSNEAYCPLCKMVITLNMASMTAHVNSSSHNDKKSSPNRIFEKKLQTSKNIETFIRIESNLGSDVILNSKFVLRQHSFHCIVMEDEGYKCMLCDVAFMKSGEQLTQHINGPDHKSKIDLCTVLSTDPEEFIREIAPEKYHCGYCNEAFKGWKEMQDHLSHAKHLYSRRHAQWNLERCHSVIRNARMTQINSMHNIIH